MIFEDQWIGRDISFSKKDIEYKLDLYEHCLGDNESLFRGYIDISLIARRFSSYNMIRNVFINKDYNLTDVDLNIPNLLSTYKDLYFLGKICYLTEQYIKNKKFNHPITVYFNPRINRSIAHPGIGRLEVYTFLDIKKIYCLYFNTGGVELESIGITNFKDFEKITLRQLLSEDDPFLLCYSLDHGSLIPQIHFNDIEKENRYNYIKSMSYRIKNLKIKTNVELDFLKPFVNNTNYNVELIFSDSFTELEIAKSIIFSLIEHEYQHDNLTVKIKNHG